MFDASQFLKLSMRIADPESRRHFRRYGFVFAPGNRPIRVGALRQLRRELE